MRNIKIGKVTLALLLIGLGFIILLQKFIGYSLDSAFLALFPCVIIVFGLEVLFNSLRASKSKNINVKIDLISIMLIVIIVSTISAKANSMFDISKLSQMRNYNSSRSYKYEKDVSEKITIPRTHKIILNDSYSDIIINKSDSENVEVSMKGTYRYNSKDYEENLTNNIIKTNIKGNTTEITSRMASKIKANYRRNIDVKNVKYVIAIPKGIDIEIQSDYSIIKIEEIENSITISSSYSDIDIEEIKGNIDLKIRYGNLSLENIFGDVKIDSEYCQNDMENIKGTIYISSKGSNTTLESNDQTENNIEIYCDYGNVELKLPKEQKGRFNLATTYGNIEDELGFNLMKSPSSKSINETRETLRPTFNVKVNKGNIKLKTN